MRLKCNIFKWSLKKRTYLAGIVWLFIAVVAFIKSETGIAFTTWIQNKAHVAIEKAHCDLAQVKVIWKTEAHYTKTEEVLQVIGIRQGMKMSEIDLNAIRKNIEHLPWVRSVIVERLLPNNLRLTIEEKTPLALWQNNKKYKPLDEYATVIETSQKLPADLLLVVGKDAPKHLLSLLKDLETVPEIYQYVRAAVRINDRRWNLRLFNAEKGVEILLPDTKIADALNRLDVHNKKEKLIKRQIAAIDLRTDDKVILKPLTPPTKKQKASKK